MGNLFTNKKRSGHVYKKHHYTVSPSHTLVDTCGTDEILMRNNLARSLNEGTHLDLKDGKLLANALSLTQLEDLRSKWGGLRGAPGNFLLADIRGLI